MIIIPSAFIGTLCIVLLNTHLWLLFFCLRKNDRGKKQ